MKTIKRDLALLLILLLLSSSKCGYDPLSAFDEEDNVLSSTTSIPKSCTAPYSGPSTTTYPQSAPFCYQAWYYRSQGLNIDDARIKYACDVYLQWTGSACKYCNANCN